MAVSIDIDGGITVDGGDQVSFDLTLNEDAIDPDNWDDAIIAFEWEAPAFDALQTYRTDDGDPQIVKVSSSPAVVRITLLESDTAADFVGSCRCYLIDTVEDERTTHRITTEVAGRRRFAVVGNPTATQAFSAVITPIPEAVLFAALADLLDDLTITDSEEASLILEDA